MAKNDAPAAEATPNGTGEAPSEPKKDRSYIVVPLTPDVKSRFESEAKAADKPAGPYVRDLLFGFLGIPIPATTVTRRSKYASAEEREAAQKERNKSRSATMRDLMKAFREAQKSGMTPEEAVKAASESVASGAPAEPVNA